MTDFLIKYANIFVISWCIILVVAGFAIIRHQHNQWSEFLMSHHCKLFESTAVWGGILNSFSCDNGVTYRNGFKP